VTVHGCEIAAAIGIRSLDPTGGQTGLTDLRIEDNAFDLIQAEGSAGNRDGVRLQAGLAGDDGLNDVQVLENRVLGFRGAAIRVGAPRVAGLMIKQNQIERTGQGIVFEGVQRLEQVAIENTQLLQIRGRGHPRGRPAGCDRDDGQSDRHARGQPGRSIDVRPAATGSSATTSARGAPVPTSPTWS
jgi:hypothetical protein